MAQQRELLGEEGVRVKACVEHAVEVSVTACALPEDNCSMLFGRHWALMTPGSSKLTLTFSLNQGCVPTLQIDAVLQCRCLRFLSVLAVVAERCDADCSTAQ